MQNAELMVKLMSRTNKIILSVVGGLIAIVAFCCLYGFTIGGDNGIFIVCMIAWSLLITASIFFFIFGKDFIKKQILIEIAVIVLTVVTLLSYFGYDILNRLSADESKTVEYETKITHSIDGKAYFIDFINSQGIDASIEYYGEILSYEKNEHMILEEAEFIYVRETPGGFGYPIYEVLGFK